jgi:hypothetical protein
MDFGKLKHCLGARLEGWGGHRSRVYITASIGSALEFRSTATRTSRQTFGESGNEMATHGGNRIGDMSLRPQRRLLWVDNLGE